MRKFIRKKRMIPLFAAVLVVCVALGIQASGSYHGYETVTVTLRVDESVGLRVNTFDMTPNTQGKSSKATPTTGYTVRGITTFDTRGYQTRFTGNYMVADVTGYDIYEGWDLADDTIDFAIDVHDEYTLTNVLITAIAEITHADGTMEAVKENFNPPVAGQMQGGSWSYNGYKIPDFSGYITEEDRDALDDGGDVSIDIEVVAYADLTYATRGAEDVIIDLDDPMATTSNAVSVNGKLVEIDARNLDGQTVRLTGGDAYVNDPYKVLITGYGDTSTIYRPYVNLILDNVHSMNGSGFNAWDTSQSDAYNFENGNFRTHTGGSNTSGTAVTARYGSYNTSGNSYSKLTNSSSSSFRSNLILNDVDVYVTLEGYNVLAQSNVAVSKNDYANGITLDGSANMVITDKSDGGYLYARGGTCSSAIGSVSNDSAACGYIEIDGGNVEAVSAFSSHHYAGIGNSGHYNEEDSGSTWDPGTRGMVFNGGTIEALGFHYGIGGTGGGGCGVGILDNGDIGPTYIVITGADVTSESSSGSSGSAIGFSWNNEVHEVRIGRPDKTTGSDGDAIVTAANWGYGAGISAKMTFYSGIVEVYSGQYAAAIGGNAIGYVNTEEPNVWADLLTSGEYSAEGTPLIVYGGKVTAVSGAYTQGEVGAWNEWSHIYEDYESIRGGTGYSIDNLQINGGSLETPVESYGASIGGACNRSGGDTNKIFAGEFEVTSSVYGAGIGGGGQYSSISRAPGTGGTTWIGKLTDISNANNPTVASMSFNMNSNTTTGGESYGAGIGGGGASSSAYPGGSGGTALYISANDSATFDIKASSYGAGIGGGGSDESDGGAGPMLGVISGGNFTIVCGQYGAGIGGGGSDNGDGGDGAENFIIKGGSFTIDMGTYGAGIGGGGSGTANGGKFPSNSVFTISDGQFNILGYGINGDFTALYGAGIGGGGTGGSGSNATGGNGAEVFTIENGNFLVSGSQYGAGIGGGGSYGGNGGDGGNDFEIQQGTFTILSGKYGAGIGGGGSYSGNGGDGAEEFKVYGTATDLTTNTTSFYVYSGKYGAGIGGGGSYSGNGGDGARDFTVYGGMFDVDTGAISYTYDSLTSNVTATFTDPDISPSYGAGIGGGGSYSGNGGDGSTGSSGTYVPGASGTTNTPLLGTEGFVTFGGVFNSESRGYGAGIGGGGSESGVGGTGGLAEYQGGTVEVASAKGYGMAGGSANTDEHASAVDNSNLGEVRILGGNIATDIISIVDDDSTQHAWTHPQTTASAGGYMTTTSATQVSLTGMGRNEVGREIGQVFFRFISPTTGEIELNASYGTDDMFATDDGTGEGVVYVWGPSSFDLTHDLTSGYGVGTEPGATGTLYFDTGLLDRKSVGNTIAVTHDNYQYETGGVQKGLLEYNYEFAADEYWDGSTWQTLTDNLNNNDVLNQVGGVYTNDYYVNNNILSEVLLHKPDANGTNVVFIGWTGNERVTDPNDSTQEYYFSLRSVDDDNMDYKDYIIEDGVYLSNFNRTVYAMWGLDENENGIADIFEAGFSLTYDENGGDPTGIPTNSMLHNAGDEAHIGLWFNPSYPGEDHIFLGWTTDETYKNKVLYAGDDLPAQADIYLFDSDANATTTHLTFSNGGYIEGNTYVKFVDDHITLYAMWGADTNQNTIPDILDTLYYLEHDPGVGTYTGLNGETVFTLPFMEGNYGVTDVVNDPALQAANNFPDVPEDANGVAFGRPTYTDNGGSTQYADFIGWTETDPSTITTSGGDGIFYYADAFILPADLADPLTTDTPFNSINKNKTVYAVWAADVDQNGTPDVYDDTLSFVFDKATADTVTNVPYDSNQYRPADTVNADTDLELDASTSVTADPYMERSGWTLLGWIDETTANQLVSSYPSIFASGLSELSFDVTEAITYANTEYVSAGSPAGSTYENYYPDTNISYLTSVAGLSFGNTDITIYAVWGIDNHNENGTPDWLEEYGRELWYTGMLPTTELDPTTMPHYSGSYTSYTVDDNGGAVDKYSNYDSVTLDSTIPEAQGYVFMGWSPFREQSYVFDKTNLDDFYTLLAVTQDAVNGTNYSGMNLIYDATTGGDAQYNLQDSYTIIPGLEDYYVEMANQAGSGSLTPPQVSAIYSAYQNEWFQSYIAGTNTVGLGMLESISFDGLDLPTNAKDDVWQVFAIWAVDANNNRIPDMLEGGYSLIYDANGGNNAPSRTTNHLPGEEVMLKIEQADGNYVNRQDINYRDMIFLGWTTDATVLDVYAAGDGGLVPDMARSVTFGDFDITVYAVWAEDLNGNGVPDCFEAGFSLTYDGNGSTVTNIPTDSTTYQYLDKVTLNDGTGMLHNSHNMPEPKNEYIFLYWTDDSSVWPVYGRNDRDDLPNMVEEIQFRTKDITVYAVWSSDDNGNGTPDVLEDNYELTYELTYDANGGSNAPTDSGKYPENSYATVLGQGSMSGPAGMPHFVGWNTAADGSGTSYMPGSQVLVSNGGITLYAQWTADSSGGNSGGNKVTVTYNANGGTGSHSVRVTSGGSYTVLSQSGTGITRSGYTFTGWNTTADGSGTTYVAGDIISNITANVTLYAQWDMGTDDSENHNGPTLNRNDHFAYIIGYPDGGVNPDGDITRAEAAVIFYRLLDDKAHTDKNDTVPNWFSDVNTQWYAQEVNYLATLGVITGYPDGTFIGSDPITRAEFATIASRFEDLEDTDGNVFCDVSETNWAAQYINSAAAKGWITGYLDGTFRPSENITRAEAVTLINRVLEREIDNAALATIENPYNDITSGYWGYGAILEASIEHEYARDDDGHEHWILDDIDSEDEQSKDVEEDEEVDGK